MILSDQAINLLEANRAGQTTSRGQSRVQEYADALGALYPPEICTVVATWYHHLTKVYKGPSAGALKRVAESVGIPKMIRDKLVQALLRHDGLYVDSLLIMFTEQAIHERQRRISRDQPIQSR